MGVEVGRSRGGDGGVGGGSGGDVGVWARGDQAFLWAEGLGKFRLWGRRRGVIGIQCAVRAGS